MPHFFLPVQDQLTLLERYIEEASLSLKDKPPGVLNVQHSHQTPQFFCKRLKSDAHGDYIDKKKVSFITDLAQKGYEEKFLQVALKQKTKLLSLEKQKLNRSASVLYHALADVYEKLSVDRKALVSPYVLPDNLFLSSWLSSSYEKKPFFPGDPFIYANSGQRMRSKSEKIIADILDNYQIPYLYEYPLPLSANVIIHPDFTLLDLRERTTVVFEHFGMMTDQQYCLTSMKKRDQYLQAGFIPGYNFLYTMEGGQHTFDQRCLEILLKDRFL